MHYYQFNIGDYSSHTKHLSVSEDICYRRLLDFYYLHEQPIPNDLAKVTRLLCLNKEYLTDVEQVLTEFFMLTDNGWINERADKEIKQYQSFKTAGAVGAAKRWAKAGDGGAKGKASGGNAKANAKQEPITNNHKPITNKYIPPIPTELLSDYSKLRKAKKAGELTETAFKAIEVQAKKAGITIVQAIEMCCLRGWVGFKSEWLDMKADREQGRQNAAKSIFKPEHLQHLQGNELKLVEGL